MTDEAFKTHLKRLQGQWPNSYGEERAKIIFHAFKHVSDIDFAEAVTECIANHRAAPLVKELDRELQEVQKRNASDRIYRGLGAAGVGGAISQAAAANKTADKEFVKACMKLWKDYTGGRINHMQYMQGCDYLDQAAGLYRRPIGKDAAAGID
jgi:hypothetical protein